MSKAIENLVEAQKLGMSKRSKAGGFPILAETLRQAGVTRNIWTLPSCQSLYHTKYGTVIQQGTPLVNGAVDVPDFNEEAFIRILRVNQAGESTFPEFLKSSWERGVVAYEVDFEARMVTYFGAQGESYVEDYPQT